MYFKLKFALVLTFLKYLVIYLSFNLQKLCSNVNSAGASLLMFIDIYTVIIRKIWNKKSTFRLKL